MGISSTAQARIVDTSGLHRTSSTDGGGGGGGVEGAREEANLSPSPLVVVVVVVGGGGGGVGTLFSSIISWCSCRSRLR